MDKNTLRSSIKAYCLELIKETSVSGDAGGYLTKAAFRKPKKQDIKSPTGFETSPKPNMYTKTMKFKIVSPKDRLNSKDLWKEIKINNPTKLKLIIGQYYDVLKYRGKNAIKTYNKYPRFYSLEEIDGEKVLWELGYKYIGDDILDDYKFNQFLEPWDGEELGWGIENVQKWIDKGLIRRGKKQEGALNESRYNQFKKQTIKPKPREVLHKAIKEIQFKLDEVNRLIEFTTRIKGELTEGEQEIEYLKRTKDSIHKIYKKLKETFEKMSSIDEIKIKNPIKLKFPIQVTRDSFNELSSQLERLGYKWRYGEQDLPTQQNPIPQIGKYFINSTKDKLLSWGEINEIKVNKPTHNLTDIKLLLKGRMLNLAGLYTKYFPGFGKIGGPVESEEERYNKLSSIEKFNMYKDAIRLSKGESI
jgi:hypothetical protein